MKKIAFIICIAFCGCIKSKVCDCPIPYQVDYMKATIIETSDVSCSLPVLDFSEDSIRARTLSGKNNLQYTVIQLPESKKVRSKKVYVSAQTLKPEEEFPCITLGYSYPHLKIMDVKDRD